MTDLSAQMTILTSYHGTHWHMNYYIEYAAFMQYYMIILTYGVNLYFAHV